VSRASLAGRKQGADAERRVSGEDGELDVYRDLEAGPDDLAVTLERVAVPEEEDSAGNEHRKESGTPAPKPRQSMLPAWRPEVAVVIASPLAGATPKQRIVGWLASNNPDQFEGRERALLEAAIGDVASSRQFSTTNPPAKLTLHLTPSSQRPQVGHPIATKATLSGRTSGKSRLAIP